MAKIDNLKYIDTVLGYRLFSNSQGFIEGYKSIQPEETRSGNRFAKDIKRIVTFATTVDEFKVWVAQGDKPSTHKYDPYKDEKQTQIPMD